MSKYLKKISKTDKISEWKSKRISSEIINKLPDNTHAPISSTLGRNLYVEFDGSCLKTIDEILYVRELMVLNIYIVYELSSDLNNCDSAFKNFLLGAVRLTKNADIDKYKYLRYGIGFDTRGTS